MCKKLILLTSLAGVLSLIGANRAGAELVGWWTLDETAGTTVADSSGQGNNGTCQGTATWVTGHLGNAWQGSTATGASATYIQIPHSESLNISNAVTVAVWVNIPTYATAQIIEKGGTAGSAWYASYGMRAESNGTLRIQWANTNWNPSTSTVPLGTWAHVAMTFDVNIGTNNNKVYVNGINVGERTWSSALTTNTFPIIVGVDNYNSAPRWPYRGMLDDLRIYNEALSVDQIAVAMQGGGQAARLASGPAPADKATDVVRDVVLSWKSGPYADKQDVYLGTLFDDVNSANRTESMGVLVSQAQTPNTYDPDGLLDFGQTYYWRVDEVNAPPDSSIDKGRTWSFTVEPYGYPITTPITAVASSSSSAVTGPENTINGSGLDAGDHHSTSATQMWLSNKSESTPPWIRYELDRVYKLHQMWVWNQNQVVEPDFGLGAKEVTIEVSTDGNIWTALTGVPEFAQATASADYLHNTTVDFGGAPAKFVKLTIQSSWGGTKQAGLSEVRFIYVPINAFGPTPASAATGVALDATLNWRPGREAVSHEVYFGTDPNALSKIGTTTEHRFDLGSAGLEYDRTYYWKVNEVNDAANPATWEGDTWSFSTVGYAVVEDFESYNDLCNRVFYAWVDQSGYNAPPECGGASAPGNGSGAVVGNPQAPYAERAILHGGNQSMPMTFDNKINPYYSETHREWSTPQVWTAGGANTLRVCFRGEAPAFLETSPGNIVMSGTGTDIYNTSDQGRLAYKSLTGDGSITARVESLANTDTWAKACVMIRETLEAGSTFAMSAYGGQNGVRFQARLTAGIAATSDTSVATPAQIALRAPVWIKMERKGNLFYGYYATDTAGSAWTPIWNPQTITMASTVYIGLAVTSHTAATDVTDIVCGARFSSVSTQGNVSGSWQLADLGVTQPMGGNAPETFYVSVQDGAGKMKVVSHPDPMAIVSGAWNEWNVPLSQITSAGVSLNNVKKLVIGVGDRNAPKAGGAGKVYIDDLRLTRVATP